jgi:hypothetical protein
MNALEGGMDVCIFAGPTLPPRDDARKQPVTWLPPAQHGDVYRAVSLLRPHAIGLVDGYFESVPSVWHKEILWAMRQGVHVFGAASMGALRAAELASFGMRGVGVIFEAYRNGVLEDTGEPFEDDDEVAVVHGPPESGYIAASEAMINIRCTLAQAERAAVLGAATRARLVGLAKALFFPERSYERLLQEGRDAGLPPAQLAALENWLPAGRVNQKRADALAMLEAIAAFVDGAPGLAEARFHFEHTTLWERASSAMLPMTVHDPDESRVLQELRLDAARWEALRREVLDSLAALEETHDPARRQALRRLRNEVPRALVERQALARIRASGEFAPLRDRAADKQARLAGRPGLPRASEFSPLQLLELADWYFSKVLGREIPEDLEGCVRDWGYQDPAQFHQAIFGEYVYRND